MAIDLVTKFAPYTDEQFKNESKKSLLTNDDFDWTGAHTIKVYKISTSTMNDYKRNGPVPDGQWSRFGPIADLDATTKLDTDETAQQLAGASALARQNREVVIPEVDSYTYGVMAANAGHKPAALALTAANIFEEITKASLALDDAEVPETGRVLLVTPAVYTLMKRSPDITLDSDVGQEMRLRGVISMMDGAAVVKVPAVRLPADFGFLMAHPSATVAPTKLEDFRIHQDPPGISGALVEGRIVYGAFVLDNKSNAIYYQALPAAARSK